MRNLHLLSLLLQYPTLELTGAMDDLRQRLPPCLPIPSSASLRCSTG